MMQKLVSDSAVQALVKKCCHNDRHLTYSSTRNNKIEIASYSGVSDSEMLMTYHKANCLLESNEYYGGTPSGATYILLDPDDGV